MRAALPRWLIGLMATTLAAEPLAALEARGLVQPEWEATLAATVLGRVDRIAVREGDVVESGAVLLELERRSEQIDAARRRIVLESTAELEAARARRDLLQRELEASRRLFESTRSVSQEEVDQKALAVRLAQSEVEQLEQREEIERLEYEYAEEQVRRRTIVAPHSGVVVEILPKLGEVCEPRQPLVRMIDATRVRVVLDVEGLRLPPVRVGERVPVYLEQPGGELRVQGTIDFVAPVIDAASGLRRMRVVVENADGRVLPGVTARVRLGAP
jgi:RND family efflux transporter MFP subunit